MPQGGFACPMVLHDLHASRRYCNDLDTRQAHCPKMLQADQDVNAMPSRECHMGVQGRGVAREGW